MPQGDLNIVSAMGIRLERCRPCLAGRYVCIGDHEREED